MIFISYLCREAFKIFDRNKDGLISMKELKKVTSMLGTMLTKEEVEDFMAEADLVNIIYHVYINNDLSFHNLIIPHYCRMVMENLIMMSLLRCCYSIKILKTVATIFKYCNNVVTI